MFAVLSRAAGGLMVAFLAAAAAAEAIPSPPMPAYRVDPAGFEAREADIRAVLDSAGRELWRHFSDHRITLFERNDRREIVIHLDTGGTFWCQYGYQFAHEFCHVLCGSRRGDRSNLWFEETLCETASLYAIRGMARSWKEHPPYPNWRDYRDSLRDDADDAMRCWSHVEEIDTLGLPSFYAKHAARLRANPVDRDLNGSMAVVLLRAFEDRPEHWEAVRWLNDRKTDAPRSFAAYLADWHESVPERHRAFVTRIARLCGQTLRADPAAAP